VLGFLYALATADAMLRTGMARCALVIGAETFSRILDWETARRACCSATEPGRWCCARGRSEDGPGVLGQRLHADGRTASCSTPTAVRRPPAPSGKVR
jgi:3-oxoacyl-[acyl-carrier-protein] synthase-3